MIKFRYALTSAACACAFVATAAVAQPAASSCQSSLAQVTQEWNAIGFATPMKPLQAQVVARDGQTDSGADVTYLSHQLRQAAEDCAAGRDAAGLQTIATIRTRLTPYAH